MPATTVSPNCHGSSVGRLLPVAIGNETVALARYFDAGRLSETEAAGACVERIDAKFQRDLIEIAVAGVLQPLPRD